MNLLIFHLKYSIAALPMSRQARLQANQLVSTINCAGNATNFAEICAGKNFFFSQDSKEICS